MNRQSSRPALCAVAGVASAILSCTPNNSVPPGAPVLTQMMIVENGTNATIITPSTGDCAQGTKDGDPCDPAGTTTLCRDVANANWCRCMMNMATTPPPDMTTTDAAADGDADGGADGGVDTDGATADGGTADDAASATDGAAAAPDAASEAPAPPPGLWSCGPFSPNSTVLYLFDRLLDTDPLQPTAAGGATGVATATFATPPPTAVTAVTDYASNGVAGAVLFPLFGDLRSTGPSLLVSGSPAMPAGAAVSIKLVRTSVLAKDGVTSFVGSGLLQDGEVDFLTGPFALSLAVPQPMAAANPDAAAPTTVPPDRTAVVATFTNLVDPMAVKAHVTVSATPVAGGAAAPVAVDVTSMDNLNVSIVPQGMTATWPASSTITVTIDANAADLVGDVLGMAQMGSFTTDAM